MRGPRRGQSHACARHRAFVWATPLVLYAAWWVAFYTPSASHRASISAAIPFAAKLAAAAAGGVVGGGLHRGALLLAVAGAAALWRIARERTITPRLGGLLITATVFWLLVGYGRGRGGVPETSRYVYAGVVLLILIFAEAFRDIRLSPPAFAIASLVALFLLSQGFDRVCRRNQLPSLHGPSHLRRARRAATGRGFAPPSMRVDNTYGRVILAGAVLGGDDAIGSSPGGLAHRDPRRASRRPRGRRPPAAPGRRRDVAAVTAPAAAARRRCVTTATDGTLPVLVHGSRPAGTRSRRPATRRPSFAPGALRLRF